MNAYHVQTSRIRGLIKPIILIEIFVLFSSCGCSHWKSQYSVPAVVDGIYRTTVDGSENILIWVNEGNVKGVFFDSISQSTRIKAPVIQFFVYDSVGRMNANYYLTKCNYRYLCQNTSVAINTENEDIRYYIAMCGKGRDCWYKR